MEVHNIYVDRRTFVRALFQLSVVGGLLDEIEDGLRQGLVGDGPCCVG